MNKRLPFLLTGILMIAALLWPAAGFAQGDLEPGDLDPSFDQDGKLITGFATSAADMLVQPDGKILVVSSVENATRDLLVLRFNPDGSPDNGFSNDGRIQSDVAGGDNEAVNVHYTADEKVLVVGETNTASEYGISLVQYYGTNGNLDVNFSGGGKAFIPFTEEPLVLFTVSASVLLPDGKILVGGVIERAESGQTDNHGNFFARFNADGSLDTSFGGNGWVAAWELYSTEFEQYLEDMAVASDGSIITAETYSNPDHVYWILARYSADGGTWTYIEPPYQGQTCARISCQDSPGGIVIQPDGKFIVTGTYTTLWGPFGDDEYRSFYTVRYNADGTLDESFGDGGAVATVVTPMPNLGDIDDHASDVTLQADGKIVVVGESQGDFALVRYNPDGSPDTTFGEDGIVKTGFGGTEGATVVDIASDGKIVAAGFKNNGIPIARYITDPQGQGSSYQILLPLVVQ